MRTAAFFVWASIFAIGAGGSMQAQTPRVVYAEGDTIPLLGQVQGIFKLGVSDTGLAASEVFADNPDPARDRAILFGSFMALQKGTALSDPPGTTIESWVDLDLSPDNRLGLIMTFADAFGGAGLGVFRNSTLVLEAGDPIDEDVPDPALQNWIYTDLKAARINASSQLLVLCDIALAGEEDEKEPALLLLETAAGGAKTGERLILRAGDALLDGPVVESFSLPHPSIALNTAGDWMAGIFAEGPASSDELIVRSGLTVAREGDPSPIPGRVYGSLKNPAVDLNDAGDWIFRASLDTCGGACTDDNAILIKNGQVFARESATLPSIAPASIESFGQAPVHIDQSGNVFWFAELDGVPARENQAFFRNDEAFLQKGLSTIGGVEVVRLAKTSYAFHTSRSGRFWLGEVELKNVGEALVSVDFGSILEVAGCVGNAGGLSAEGATPLAGSTVRLQVEGAQSLGALPIVLWSRSQLAPCGIALPFGEILIGAAASQTIGQVVGPPWNGAPLPIFLQLPDDPSLVDFVAFGQGIFVDSSGQPGVPGLRLTNALRMEIGAP